MVRDKNADKRLEYNRKIANADYVHDDLLEQKRTVLRNLESFQNSFDKSFQNLKLIDEELAVRSQVNSNNFYDENQQKHSYIKKILNGQKEETEVHYRKALQENEEVKEQLQKERDNLSWD